jgi:hypothetical protein
MTPYHRRKNPYIIRMAQDMQIRNLAAIRPNADKKNAASLRRAPGPKIVRFKRFKRQNQPLPAGSESQNLAN